jgi:hypothetical protein
VRTGSSFCSIYQPAPVSEKKEFEMPIPKVTSRQLLAHITKMLSLSNQQDMVGWLTTELEKLEHDNPLLAGFIQDRCQKLAQIILPAGNSDHIAHTLLFEYVVLISIINGAIDAKEFLVAHSFKDDELKGLDTL